MRKWLVALLFCALSTNHSLAQDLTLSEVFRQMPDSLMPYLSHNNRLDFIDFMEAGMKAEVRNSLGGTSEMTALASDSLSIRMSESMRCDILLLPLSTPVDSVTHVVAVVQTFIVDSVYGQSTVDYYTTAWQPIIVSPVLTEEQNKRIQRHIMQNILKRDEEFLNKR